MLKIFSADEFNQKQSRAIEKFMSKRFEDGEIKIKLC
jgi:F0F1-type ATP synthase delta subunit